MRIRPLVPTVLGATLLAACAGRRVAETPALPVAGTPAPPAAEAPAPPAAEAPAPPAAEAPAPPAAEGAPPALSPAPVPPAVSSPPNVSTDAVSFETSVKPLLARTCTPCHVPGGIMYGRLPFDQPEVVASHQDGILRRLRKRSAEDAQVLERWLASHPKS